MEIRIFYLAIGLLLSNFLYCQSNPQPNIIIIIADDAAWNDSGAYGNTSIKTPNINKLAKEGLVFDNAFLTTSSCSPSRCSILTGRYPRSTGAPELHMPLPKDQILFAGNLQKVGYFTAAIGKYHIGPERKEFNQIQDSKPSGAELWVKTLKERPKDKPFFMWFAAHDPHRPYTEETIKEPHDPKKIEVPPYLPDNDSTRIDLARYYDEISRLDMYLGDVMEELKRQKVDDNTLVIFMSDNGRPFPRDKTRLYDSGIKTPFIVRWPKSIKSGRTNALISAIDIAPTLCELAGASMSESFQGNSFVPLLKDPNASIRDKIVAEHNWHDYQSQEQAVRTQDFLYIRNALPYYNASPPADAVNSPTYRKMIEMHNEAGLEEEYMDCFIVPRPGEELYNVKKDPYQMHNLSQDPEYSDTLELMSDQLDEWLRIYGEYPFTPLREDKFYRWTGQVIKTD